MVSPRNTSGRSEYVPAQREQMPTMGCTSTVEYRSSLFHPEYGKDGGRSEMCATRPWTSEPVNTILPIARAGPDRGTESCLNLAVQRTVREREDRGHDALPGGNGIAYVSGEVTQERAE